MAPKKRASKGDAKKVAENAPTPPPEAEPQSAGSDPLSIICTLFPLTHPTPDPFTDHDLIPPDDIALEQELLLNPDNPRTWLSYIHHVVQANTHEQPQPDTRFSSDEVRLLGPLASPASRLGLRRVTLIYERTLARFPTSYPIWRDYLVARSAYVLGEPVGGRAAARRKQLKQGREALEMGPTLLDNVEGGTDGDDGLKWEGGLDPVVGWKEWRSLAALFERALVWLPRMPRIWLLYFDLFEHPLCPPILSRTHARRTFDRALRTLPPSLHLRVWKFYLRWAERVGGETCLRVWRRYLRVDPSLTERYVRTLLAPSGKGKGAAAGAEDEEGAEQEEEEEEDGEAIAPRVLEAAKLLLSLARGAADGTYTSPEGKSPYKLLTDWLDLCEKYPEAVGLSVEEEAEALAAQGAEEQPNGDSTALTTRPSTGARGGRGGARGRGRGGSTSQGRAEALSAAADGTTQSSETDPLSPVKLPVGLIVRQDGLKRYPDQAGRLWTGLATYYIKRGELDTARDTFEEGLRSVVTVRDFSQIFDAYAETSENVISYLMDELASEEEDEDEEQTREQKEEELDGKMKDLEELMERRPFLVNDVLLRRNPDDVQEWEKRVALYGEDDDKVIDTYRKAIDTINPRKATANFHQLFLNFARFYEGDEPRLNADGEEEDVVGDLDSARKIFERAITVPFKRVDDLAELWCEWAEMEVRHSNYEQALRVMARATAPPGGGRTVKSVQYHDDTLPPQVRLFKSLKLWSFYVDLEESVGTTQGARAVYDRIIEMKIANPQIIINYAAFLEEHKYFEDSFKVYERGVDAFTYPVAFELWNVYLSKFVKRYGGTKIERARDLFEQALEKCPAKFAKPILLMYGKLEEDYGLAKRAMAIYDRATKIVSDEDRFDMFAFYIAKAAANFGLAATRPIYERSLEVLPDKQTAEACLRFAAMERKLGEIDRARAIYAHGSQFCDPRTNPAYWKEWNAFEIETGSEDTFREMRESDLGKMLKPYAGLIRVNFRTFPNAVRIKRSVQAQFNTDVSYIAASALSASQRNKMGAAALAESNTDNADPMAQAEAAAAAAATSGAPAFVASKAAPAAPARNEEVVGGDDDDDDDLM